MNDAWDERRRAKEEQYFQKQNEEALRRIKSGERKPRISPISGQPMQEVVIDGVTVDRCATSGGIWLDAGELEEIVSRATNRESASGKGPGDDWIKSFLSGLFMSKTK